MKKKTKRKVAAVDFDFESAMTQLQQIVGDLESGELGLNDSMQRYEDGVRHLSRCFELLSGAERRIALLTGVDADGNPVTEAFEDEDGDLDQKAASRSKRRTAKSANHGARNVVDDTGGLF